MMRVTAALRGALLVGAGLLLLAGRVDAQEPAREAPVYVVPAAPITLDGNRLVLPGPVSFATGAATLTPESDAALAAAAAWLVQKDYITTARVEGHVAGGGDAAASQRLSEERAMAVAKALVAKGVACGRLLPVGFGDTKPVAANDTAEGRAANTRVEIHNAALRGRPIGGMPVEGGGRVAGDPCK